MIKQRHPTPVEINIAILDRLIAEDAERAKRGEPLVDVSVARLIREGIALANRRIMEDAR